MVGPIYILIWRNFVLIIREEESTVILQLDILRGIHSDLHNVGQVNFFPRGSLPPPPPCGTGRSDSRTGLEWNVLEDPFLLGDTLTPDSSLLPSPLILAIPSPLILAPSPRIRINVQKLKIN